MDWMRKKSQFYSLQKQESFVYTKESRLPPGPMHPPTKWVLAGFFTRVELVRMRS